jgi:predicted N-acetyltransferase YhbS
MEMRLPSMNHGTIDLTVFDEHHLDGALLLSREAGWPHRREDWAMTLSLSKGLVALQAGKMVGTVMMTPFGEGSATINMVIVAAAARGHGLGRRLMDAALAAAGQRSCSLIATTDGLPLYRKLGFEVTHEICQHQGIVSSDMFRTPISPHLSWATAADRSAIGALDRQAVAMDRGQLLDLLTETSRIAVLRDQDQIIGYGALRAFGRGEIIGPVVTDSKSNAQAIVSFLVAARSGEFLRSDTPNFSALSPWLSAHGLPEVGGGIAMVRAAAAPQPSGPARLFALASQALG